MLVTQGLQLATGQLVLFFQAWKFFGPSPVPLAQALDSTPPYLPLLALTSHRLCILMFCKGLSGKVSRVLLHGLKPVSLVFSYEQTEALLEPLLVARLSCPTQAPKINVWG